MPYLREQEPSPQESLWPGHILAAKMNFWAGKEGVGKGLLLADVHARLARGAPMPPWDDDDPEAPKPNYGPSQSILIELEDDESEVWRRVSAAAGPKADRDARMRVFNMGTVNRDQAEGSMDERFSLPADFPALRKKIREMNRHDLTSMERRGKDLRKPCDACGAESGDKCAELGPCRLVSINPIMAACTTTVSRNQQSRIKLINPMVQIANDFGVAIVVVGHFFRGANPDNFRDKLGGSKAWLDASRLVNVVWPHPENPEVAVLAPLKSNYGNPQDAQVQYKIKADGYADPDARVIYKEQDTDDSEERLEAKINGILESTGGRVDARQIAAYLGYSYARVHAAMLRMAAHTLAEIEEMTAIEAPATEEHSVSVEYPQPLPVPGDGDWMSMMRARGMGIRGERIGQ